MGGREDVVALLYVHEIAENVLLLQERMFTRSELTVPFNSFKI